MSRTHSILNEQPLMFTPSLACHIGVEAAIVIQKVHFLANTPNSGREIGGHRWIWNTLSDWRTNFFPFWSTRTIGRILDELEKMGVLVTCQPDGNNRTKFYRVNQGVYEHLTLEAVDAEGGVPCCQVGRLQHAKLATCYITDTTSETTKGAFHARVRGYNDRNRRPIPKTEEEMYATLEANGITPDPDHDGGFFDNMCRAKWKVRGKPVADWAQLYRGRLDVSQPQ